jgi:hypothetical protein
MAPPRERIKSAVVAAIQNVRLVQLQSIMAVFPLGVKISVVQCLVILAAWIVEHLNRRRDEIQRKGGKLPGLLASQRA